MLHWAAASYKSAIGVQERVCGQTACDLDMDSPGRQAPVVQKVDNAIHRINHYPLDIAIGFAITYPVDSDLSGG